jgi:hypothetical protein
MAIHRTGSAGKDNFLKIAQKKLFQNKHALSKASSGKNSFA